MLEYLAKYLGNKDKGILPWIIYSQEKVTLVFLLYPHTHNMPEANVWGFSPQQVVSDTS